MVSAEANDYDVPRKTYFINYLLYRRAMKLEVARDFALNLPGATEEPHFEKTSWRVNRKIFATVPDGGRHLHIFVDEAETRALTGEDPSAYEELCWGKKLVGVRVNLPRATRKQVLELIEEAWRLKAPKRLLNTYEREGDDGVVRP